MISVRWAAVAVLSLEVCAPVGAGAAECDNPVTRAEIAYCIGMDLRSADAKINSTYKEVMVKLGEVEKKQLRDRQRAWIKDRDRICVLDTKETNRDRWYEALLQDYSKAVCVTRLTRRRQAELQAMLIPSASPAATSQTSGGENSKQARRQVPDSEPVLDRSAPTTHEKGKWYFEVAIDFARVVATGPTVVSAGVKNDSLCAMVPINVRERNRSRSPEVIGFALDLDTGKLYTSRNGTWHDGAPGSSGGIDLKLGRKYYALVTTSSDDLRPYITSGAVRPRFGDGPMEYALPDGYRPWRDKLVTQ